MKIESTLHLKPISMREHRLKEIKIGVINLELNDPCPFCENPLITQKEYNSQYLTNIGRKDYRLVCKYGHECVPEHYKLVP